MPNWRTNVTVLKHDAPKMLRWAQAADRRGKFAEALLPMPGCRQADLQGRARGPAAAVQPGVRDSTETELHDSE